MIAQCATTIAAALLPVANVFLTREVVNSLTGLQSPLDGALPQFLIALACLVGIILLGEIVAVVADWIQLNHGELVSDEVQTRIHQVVVKADYKFFEIPEYQDQLYLATSGADDEFTDTIENLFTFARSVITLIAMITVIAGFGLWLPLALAIAAIPTLIVVLTQSRRDHELRKSLVPDERRADYYDWLIQSNDAAAEIRTYKLGDRFVNRFRDIRSGIRRQQLRLEKRQMFHRLSTDVFGLCILGGAMVFVVARAISGQVTIGDVAMFYRSIKYSHDVGIEFVKSIGSLQKNAIQLGEFYQFVDSERERTVTQRQQTFPTALRAGITFQDVCFTYPQKKSPTLRELNLTIPAGKMTTILGPNGSGKSTLLKLLAQLYTDYEGQITIEGRNIREFSTDELRSNLSFLFQDPMEYHFSALENITGKTSEDQKDIPDPTEAITAAAADSIVSKLPEGLNSQLGKWLHEGAELSGGEWHRLATARALYGKKQIIVMDEPTSSLDPWAELEWTQRIRNFLRSRTVIIITHRAAIARLSDHICVMESGRVCEEGSHQELVDEGGAYARICT